MANSPVNHHDGGRDDPSAGRTEIRRGGTSSPGPAPPDGPGRGTEVDRSDENGVRTLVFNRPARLNAFTAASYRMLAAALNEAADDDSVRVVELVGAGRAFSSGVDLDALAAADTDEYADAFAVLLPALTEFPKPLLAGVHGAAVGFGSTILLHADVVVVADDARLRLPFAQLGTVPEAASSVLLPAQVGLQRATELILTGRWMDAAEAVRLGLARPALCPRGSPAGASGDREPDRAASTRGRHGGQAAAQIGPRRAGPGRAGTGERGSALAVHDVRAVDPRRPGHRPDLAGVRHLAVEGPDKGPPLTDVVESPSPRTTGSTTATDTSRHQRGQPHDSLVRWLRAGRSLADQSMIKSSIHPGSWADWCADLQIEALE